MIFPSASLILKAFVLVFKNLRNVAKGSMIQPGLRRFRLALPGWFLFLAG